MYRFILGIVPAQKWRQEVSHQRWNYDKSRDLHSGNNFPGKHRTYGSQAATDKYPNHEQTIHPIACLWQEPVNYLLIGNYSALHPESKSTTPVTKLAREFQPAMTIQISRVKKAPV
jgi:hypothetical protein